MAVQLYTSSVSGNSQIKKQQLQIKNYLDARNISYQEYDIASDEQAKEEMKSKSLKQVVPQIFVDGEFRGLYEDFENAVEAGEADSFFK